jgi:hypothetical protein
MSVGVDPGLTLSPVLRQDRTPTRFTWTWGPSGVTGRAPRLHGELCGDHRLSEQIPYSSRIMYKNINPYSLYPNTVAFKTYQDSCFCFLMFSIDISSPLWYGMGEECFSSDWTFLCMTCRVRLVERGSPHSLPLMESGKVHAWSHHLIHTPFHTRKCHLTTNSIKRRLH